MTDLPDRAALRTALTEDLKLLVVGSDTPLATEVGVGGAEHAFAYMKKDPSGVSPFACVDSGSIRYDLVGSDELQTPIILIVGFWARRSDDDSHDDMLDGLALALAKMLRAKYIARIPSRSVTDFEVLDGIPYKFELHFVEFLV
jgi:hypothetical protein